jgi:hypothetical protein
VLNPGTVATLWGTGLGPVTFPDSGPAPADLSLTDLRASSGVSIIVGGKEATITYAGRTPGLSGLDQINFVVPQGVTGCSVPVVVRTAAVAGNFTTVPIAETGNTCSDPNGLTAADLANAQTGSLAVGFVGLNRTTIRLTIAGQTLDTVNDFAFGSFERFDYNSFIRTGAATTPFPGACTVSTYRGTDDPDDPIQSTSLDAGAKLTLTGPGLSKDLSKANGLYSVLGTQQTIPGLPTTNTTFLAPGSYTIAGTGGADVGAFSANVTIPAPLTWSNPVTSVPRSQNLVINWTGGTASDTVYIAGSSTNSASNVTASFQCYANAAAGTFTVPSYVLGAMPLTTVTEGIPAGTLAVGSYGIGSRFNASGINFGILSYSATVGANVAFQ